MTQYRALVALAVTAIGVSFAQGQQPPPPASVPTQPPKATSPPANAVAATVNGHSIHEVAIHRALIGVPPAKHVEYRAEIMNYLIDNALIDQYLDQMKIDVDPKEVDVHIGKLRAELQTKGKTLEEVYAGLLLSEADLRIQVRATLRWDRFIDQYGPEKALREFFESNKAIFDGSAMHARHILLKPAAGNPQADAEAKARITLLKKHLEGQVKQVLEGAANLDNLEKQKLKMKLLDENFGALAAKESICPSKEAGGDLGWFPRVGGGRVSEGFAKSAFTLKPWELSEPVQTEHGYHLILCMEYKAGVEPKFEMIKDLVRDVYADKMREAVAARMRQTAKIQVNGAK